MCTEFWGLLMCRSACLVCGGHEHVYGLQVSHVSQEMLESLRHNHFGPLARGRRDQPNFNRGATSQKHCKHSSLREWLGTRLTLLVFLDEPEISVQWTSEIVFLGEALQDNV